MSAKELREKMKDAFGKLENMGIAAKANFACCMSCGVSEIQEFSGTYPKGFVFWHMQDDEDLSKGESFYLGYGAFKKGKPESVGKKVVNILSSYGIKTIWDGNADTRIKVCP